MEFKRQILSIFENLSRLDRNKKIALASVFGLIFLGTIAFSTLVNRAAFTPLYSGLTTEDINGISRLLSQNGIDFAIDPEKGIVEVAPRQLAEARILLAEQGLPTTKASGYDLFDQVNTFGLTSFMQEVTNKRAIEGELIRTLRMIEGITAARVHLVMPEKNVFRRDLNSGPSASVIIKTLGSLPERSVFAVRNLVAAAVPGLGVDNVTVVDASGATIAAPGEVSGRGTAKLIEYEAEFERDLTRKISTAVGSFLGESNYRVSVTAKLNTDQTRREERVFDPDSKVARSEQTMREASNNENREGEKQVTIQQNLPEETENLPSAQLSRENDERREETINYEINEKRIETQSDGYTVEAISIALIVNNQRVTDLLGENPDPVKVDELKMELQRIVTAAASVSDVRGDKVEISMLDFVADPLLDADYANSGIVAIFATHLGSIINAIGMIVVSLILSFVVLKPIVTFLTFRSQVQTVVSEATPPLSDATVQTPDQLAEGGTKKVLDGGGKNDLLAIDMINSADEQMSRLSEQLRELVERNEDRVVAALRRWLMEDELASKAKL